MKIKVNKLKLDDGTDHEMQPACFAMFCRSARDPHVLLILHGLLNSLLISCKNIFKRVKPDFNNFFFTSRKFTSLFVFSFFTTALYMGLKLKIPAQLQFSQKEIFT